MATESTTSPAVRVAGTMNVLSPSERRVAEVVQSDPELIIESTAQELADRIGIARTSVIRSAQRLGYRGYAQLRVAVSRSFRGQQAERPPLDSTGTLGALLADVHALAQRLPESMGLLNEAEVERAVARLAEGRRILCIGNALSGPLAADAAMRLSAIGLAAEHPADAFAQQVVARHLDASDVALVISGSGANELSLRAASAARASGATVIAVTSFGSSPLVEIADVPLVIATVHETFRSELEHTSRIAHTVFLDALLARIGDRLGGRALSARGLTLDVLSENLAESGEY